MIPRCEHPRPDLYREAWLNLNGEWQFDFWSKKDFSGYNPDDALSKSITVPFCPESVLSGGQYGRLMAKMGSKMNDGMLMPYRKLFDKMDKKKR